ncbi:hypothetical protein [Azospirillum sp. BE72]|uniref:hypothetical protein n=1 Tax=Azospirillum sp. BE72 TaxID=2817776 RepID=UPI002861D2D3|nr:hypothetical protein [Azospirillum sp. BE72]MDR6771863.1 hypothetical protein [Azospirillum sp. BE72]
MSTTRDFLISITIESTTFTSLKNSGYNLFGMVGVISSNKSGRPAVVVCTNTYFQNNTVTLSGQLTAYDSGSQIADNATIQIGNQITVTTGQFAVIDGNGSLSVTSGAPANTVYIVNNASVDYTVGIARNMSIQNVPPSAVPAVAFDAQPSSMVTTAPTGSALFFFGTSTYQSGTILTTCLGPAVAIDLSTAPASVTLPYDQAQGGWVTNGASYLDKVAAGSDLTPILIRDPGPNVPASKAVLVSVDSADMAEDQPPMTEQG